jgi:hypothetical protein
MQFTITIDDQLWITLKKETQFTTDEEALKFWVVNACYASGKISASQGLLQSDKIQVNKL